MSDCELYPMFNLKGALRIWQMRYCEHAERFRTCARYELARQGKKIPLPLLPNGRSLDER